MQKFKFKFYATMEIEAEGITDAVEQFRKELPGMKDSDIGSITSYGRSMGRMQSRETGECIYFKPGCQCAKNDCIHDPMRKIAEGCAHQSDMTEDKWESCSRPDPFGDACFDYETR